MAISAQWEREKQMKIAAKVAKGRVDGGLRRPIGRPSMRAPCAVEERVNRLVVGGRWAFQLDNLMLACVANFRTRRSAAAWKSQIQTPLAGLA